VSVVDTRTKEIRDIPGSPSATLAGIDGLYLIGRSLVAVQNGIGPGRVMRFVLAPSLDRVERAEVLESRHPSFEIPTTGALAGDSLYLIANSQLRKLGPDGKIADPSALDDVVILKVPL
jgi:hypothetical protein